MVNKHRPVCDRGGQRDRPGHGGGLRRRRRHGGGGRHRRRGRREDRRPLRRTGRIGPGRALRRDRRRRRWPPWPSAPGPVDVLVNNAGVGMTGRFADMSVDDWRWIRSVNLDGVVHGCAAFGPAMLATGLGPGRQRLLRAGLHDAGHRAAYVATKAAVLALSRCLRADWAPHGVGVTAVCPGVIDTPIVGSTRYLGARGDARTRSRDREDLPPGPPAGDRGPGHRRRRPRATGPSSRSAGKPASAGTCTASPRWRSRTASPDWTCCEPPQPATRSRPSAPPA